MRAFNWGLITALPHHTRLPQVAPWGHFLPLPPVFPRKSHIVAISPVPLRVCPFCLVLVSLTHSQLTSYISPIFDRFGLSVFRGKHLRVVDEGIHILSKGPSLPSLCSNTTHTPSLHCNYCTCHNDRIFRSSKAIVPAQ